MSRLRRAVFAVAVATTAVAQQGLSVRALDANRLSVVAVDVFALDVLVAAAKEQGLPMRTEPVALAALGAKKTTIRRTSIGTSELALLVGGIADVDVFVRDGAIVANAYPNGADGIRARLRASVRTADYALAAYPDATTAAALSASRGRVALAAGDFDVAYDSFQGVGRSDLTEEERQELRVWSAEAALRAGRVRDALASVESFERSTLPLPQTPGAELVSPRVRLASGDESGAGVRLRRVVREGSFPRDRAVACFMLAEIAWRARDGRGMLRALDALTAKDRRDYPDLARREPHVTGLALSLLGEYDSAILSYRLALKEDPDPRRRARTARRIAEALRDSGRPFEALLAARQAATLDGGGPEAVRIAVIECALLQKLGLATRSLERALDALGALDGPGPDADLLVAAAAEAAVAAGDDATARKALDALMRRPGFGPRADRLEAELLRRAGRPAAALKILDAFDPETARAAGFDYATLQKLKGALALEAGDPLLAARILEAPPAPEKDE
jgi:tetratricopeptide (TPR) repeat protein